MNKIEVTKDLVTKQTQFIAVEGVDCTGKGSITELIEREGVGIPGVKTKRIDFPQYELPSGQMILKYLNGDYGDTSRLLEPVPKVAPEEWLALVVGRANNMRKEVDFIASLYSLNRIEYFLLNPPEPNTVYVFDRYMYSNAIHQLSMLYDFFKHREGNKLIESDWIINHQRIRGMNNFADYSNRFIASYLTDCYNEWVKHEILLGVPEAYEFILDLDLFTIMERMKKRKSGKHSGDDILERQPAIARACSFISECKDFACGNDITEISVKDCDENNTVIAHAIVDMYKTYLSNGVGPHDVYNYYEYANSDEED